MSHVSIQELQRDATALLDRVAAGEHLIISRNGRPVAEMTPLRPVAETPRPVGLAAGDFVVPDDFDTPLPDDIARAFEGR